jgi:arylsulfatase A-like enzyme
MRSPRWCGLALVILLASCRGRELGPVIYDFAEAGKLATLDREVQEIVFGMPAGRSHLKQGWSGDERTPDGRPFVWSEGGESSLEFFLASPRRLSFGFRCAPLGLPGLPEQAIATSLNGHHLADFTLAAAPRWYRTSLPADALVAGTNRLTFRYAYVRRPADVDARSSDRRPLAVSWFDARLGEGQEGVEGPPEIDAGTRTLRVPAGSQVAFHLKLPPGSSLAVDSVDLGGPGRTSLSILLQPEGRPEQELARLARSRSSWSVPLSEPAETIARISFRAVAGPRGSGSATLVRPVLRRGELGPLTASSSPASPAPSSPAKSSVGRRPHVFIYLVDTLRADHLGCYGYGRPVSPHLDAFAREGSVFRGIAPSSWTKASVASLMTGLPPIVHRAQDRGDTLTPDTVTLAKLLGAAGYRTYALYANTWVSGTFGLDQGFAERRFLVGPSDRLNRELFEWLRRTRPDDRLFAYVHTIDPHTPYSPPPAYRARFAPARGSLRRVTAYRLEDLAASRRRGNAVPPSLIEEIQALYDGEIAFNDAQFGLLLDELKRRGLYDDSLVIFASDHGEEFFDHGGVSHGQTLFSEVLDVPIVVKWPRGTTAPTRPESEPARLEDLLPTILDCVALPAPPGADGRSLLRPRSDEPRPAGSGVLSYLDLDTRKIQSVTEGRWKLIRHGAADDPRATLELYDLEAGKETADVRDRHPIVAAYLLAQLEAQESRAPRTASPPQAEFSEEVKDRLRALGYLR